ISRRVITIQLHGCSNGFYSMRPTRPFYFFWPVSCLESRNLKLEVIYMGVREQVIKDIETLKDDTSKVIKDLSTLSSSLADTAGSAVTKRVDSAQARLESELKRIQT